MALIWWILPFFVLESGKDWTLSRTALNIDVWFYWIFFDKYFLLRILIINWSGHINCCKLSNNASFLLINTKIVLKKLEQDSVYRFVEIDWRWRIKLIKPTSQTKNSLLQITTFRIWQKISSPMPSSASISCRTGNLFTWVSCIRKWPVTRMKIF